MQQACFARPFWHYRDGEEVKREVICSKEEEKKRQEQVRYYQSLITEFC